MDAIATSAVHIALSVAFYTVWDTCVGHGEQSAVGEERLS